MKLSTKQKVWIKETLIEIAVSLTIGLSIMAGAIIF